MPAALPWTFQRQYMWECCNYPNLFFKNYFSFLIVQYNLTLYQLLYQFMASVKFNEFFFFCTSLRISLSKFSHFTSYLSCTLFIYISCFPSSAIQLSFLSFSSPLFLSSSSFSVWCAVTLQSSSAASMDAVLEVLSKQPADRTPEDVGMCLYM